MIDISSWMDAYMQALDTAFGKRVWFVGLQGSYGRGEATEKSDIDIVVILDKLSAADIQIYNAMLDGLEHRGLICGFLSGKDEILNWDASDLFQFYHDTTPIRGSLAELLPMLDEVAVARAIKIGACNIYHGCVHNMLYEKSEDILRGLYKAASFVIQAACYQRTGTYVRRQKDLLGVAAAQDQEITETFMKLKNGCEVDFTEISGKLFVWAKSKICG